MQTSVAMAIPKNQDAGLTIRIQVASIAPCMISQSLTMKAGWRKFLVHKASYLKLIAQPSYRDRVNKMEKIIDENDWPSNVYKESMYDPDDLNAGLMRGDFVMSVR